MITYVIHDQSLLWLAFSMSYFLVLIAGESKGPLTLPVGTPILRTVEVLRISLSALTEWVRIPIWYFSA